jgi:hypothetical protein
MNSAQHTVNNLMPFQITYRVGRTTYTGIQFHATMEAATAVFPADILRDFPAAKIIGLKQVSLVEAVGEKQAARYAAA